MSLLDALLLDPTPFNIWIAIRTDGIKGSGTVNDPYDGGPVFGTSINITNLARTGTLATATVGSTAGFSNGDTVLIAGATGADGGFYNGYFTIQNVQSTSFQYVMDGTPVTTPATGTIKATKVTGTKLDAVMTTIPANTHIHLGVGFFFTLGYAIGLSGTWQAKQGMKIVGSGMDVTTLKLINVAPGSAAHYFAIGHSLASKVDAFEVSDLTIDCNLASANSNAACGGVRVLGNHTRIRSIKVKNWGTKTTSMPCYGIAAITGDLTGAAAGVVDCRIEECILIQPGSSVTNGIVTAIHAGPNDQSGASTAEAFGTGSIIRNCFVDCGSPTATAVHRGLSMSWCRGGIVEGNQIHNTKYGGPYSDKTTIRELIVRNNYYKNVAKGPFWSLGNLCTTALNTGGSVSLSSGVLTIGISAHTLQAGDRFKLVTASGAFNGTYRVDTVVDINSIKVKTSASGSNTTVNTNQGSKKVFSADKLVVEGNIVELATGSTGVMGIHIHDIGSGTTAPTPDFVHGDVIVRNNHIRYLDGAYDATYAGRGIEVNGAKNLLVHNNVAKVAEATNDERLRNARCGAVKYFNNRVPDGTLVRGVNKDTTKKYNELETDAEDAMFLSLLNKQ